MGTNKDHFLGVNCCCCCKEALFKAVESIKIFQSYLALLLWVIGATGGWMIFHLDDLSSRDGCVGVDADEEVTSSMTDTAQ